VNKALPFAAVLCLSSLACSSSTKTATNTGGGAKADAGFVPFAASPTTFSMTGASIAPSTEAFNCTYVQMPAQDGYVVAAQHEYTAGSHHMLMYHTTLTAIPAGLGSPTIGDCNGANARYMTDARSTIYGGQTPTGSLELPAGIGIPYKANEVLVFQVHYVNATSAPLTPEIYVHLDVSPGPVTQNAGGLFFYAPFIYVPQGAMGVASNRCPITQDITLLTQQSHYHARGVNYQAFLDTSPTTPSTTPIYTSSNWESPPQQSTTMQIKAGSDIRYYCYYDNTLGNAGPGSAATTGTEDFIQGQSAVNNEMCMFVGVYYPAMSTVDEQCQNGDMYGTGTTACTDTITCLGACPPNTDAGALGVDFNECIQKCFVSACPEATGPAITALSCIQSKCASECASSASSTCTSCVISNCATEYGACSSATCGTVPAAPGSVADGG
jgi:hypothetical protein